MFGFGKSSKPRAAVFVDYEHWFYGYHNNFHMRPNFEEWIQELKNEYDIDELHVFGDFSERQIGAELPELQRITNNNVTHTASDKLGVDKDFTDVIILDHIYRSAAKKKSADVYVLFTGDAHFTCVVDYLKELNKKVVLYGVKFGFSNALKSAATSYVEMPRQIQVKNHYNDLILASLDKLRRKPGKTPSYWKTIDSVAKYNRVPEDRVKKALDGLISQKYISQTTTTDARGEKISLLTVDWDKLSQDGIWQ